MNDITVARRYAQAIYEEAQRENRTEEVDADIDLIRGTLEGSRDLVLFFGSPIISREKKEAVVRQLFADRLSPLTLHFLQLLVEKGRENLFPDVVRAYHVLRDRHLGIVEVHVRTAFSLGEEEERALIQALEQKTGRRVRLLVKVEPALMGGLVIRIGDTVYDGSVQHQLENLREQLEHGTFQVRQDGQQGARSAAAV